MPLEELTRDLDVLVVDDEPTVRELLLEYFNGLGFRVTGADDGRSAIELLQRAAGRFALVITDLNLPGADGFAVLQAARRANPHCFVVIITGYASLDSAIRAVRVGAYDYLTKPFSLAQLDIILTRIRERRAQQLGQAAPAVAFSSAPRPPARVQATPAMEKPVPVPVAVPQVAAPASAAIAALVPVETTPVVTSEGALIVPADGTPMVPELLPTAPNYVGMSSYNVAQRLGLLEAAFGRIEALLREKR